MRKASGARHTPPPTPSPLTTHVSSVQAICAAGGWRARVGRGGRPKSQLEAELIYAARAAGRSSRSVHIVENVEASPRLLGPQPAPAEPAAAAGRCTRPAEPAAEVARGESARWLGPLVVWRAVDSEAGSRPFSHCFIF